ncbi:MAG: glycine C-acetyltransferase [Phycisphaerae bacterium]|nr:glycine C-acetyltransferase [Phycisphaerae bacterium]
MDIAAASQHFESRAQALLQGVRDSGQWKHLKTIESAMDPEITLEGHGDVLCFCSNNYLGLANEARVVQAGHEGLDRHGGGTASVRFICGTFSAHHELEQRIASFFGFEASYTFVSCWTATEALFPTLCTSDDAIISDELNHACIIDGIRLAASIHKGLRKTVYRHSDMDHLRERLMKLRSDDTFTGVVWIVTDGVFSMEGDIAKLAEIRMLCDEFGAMLIVDDSHGHGVMGKTGRGTHEHCGLRSEQVDILTGTLGKALGGGAGGFVAGSQTAIDLLVQRARPTLFSNALPTTVAASAEMAIRVLQEEPERVDRLRANADRARSGIRDAGFEVLESPTAICPIIVGDTARAIRLSERLLEKGVFVIGFGYPVVPEGEARLRVQISAAHTEGHIDRLVNALKELKAEEGA